MSVPTHQLDPDDYDCFDCWYERGAEGYDPAAEYAEEFLEDVEADMNRPCPYHLQMAQERERMDW